MRMSSCFEKSLPPIPKRWIISTMGFFAFFNAYTLRTCLSMAITKMARPLNITEKSHDETCPNYEDHISKNITIVSGGIFEWNEYTQGIILSSFYWGYIPTHLPGGLLADKFGAKYAMGLGILFTAILSIITPSATYWGDAKALIAVRFLMGLCEGVIQPAMSCLLAQWIPSKERSMTTSLVYTGIKIGILMSSIISGLILGRYNNDWPLIFYLFGSIGILWFLFWIFLGYNNPREHPSITLDEREYLNEQLGDSTQENVASFPWKCALTSKSFMALIIIQSGCDWSTYTIMSDLPKYMNSVLKLPVHVNGYASSIHNIGSWLFCMVMSWCSDWLIVKKYLSRTNVRKMNAVIATMGPGIMLIGAMYAGCNVIATISLITIGLTLSGSSIPGIKVNVLDLSPNYAGTLMGISNGIGAFTGILAPYTVGVLAPNQTLIEWRQIFWIIGGIYFISALIFMKFASGEIQKWNDPAFLMDKEKKIDDLQQDTNISLLHTINLSNKYDFYEYTELKYLLFIGRKSF